MYSVLVWLCLQCLLGAVDKGKVWQKGIRTRIQYISDALYYRCVCVCVCVCVHMCVCVCVCVRVCVCVHAHSALHIVVTVSPYKWKVSSWFNAHFTVTLDRCHHYRIMWYTCTYTFRSETRFSFQEEKAVWWLQQSLVCPLQWLSLLL